MPDVQLSQRELRRIVLTQSFLHIDDSFLFYYVSCKPCTHTNLCVYCSPQPWLRHLSYLSMKPVGLKRSEMGQKGSYCIVIYYFQGASSNGSRKVHGDGVCVSSAA